MINSVKQVQNVLRLYTEGDEELHLRLIEGEAGNNLVDGYPTELSILNADQQHLASLFSFEDGLTTVLQVLGTSFEALTSQFNLTYQPRKLRVRRVGEGFEVRSASL